MRRITRAPDEDDVLPLPVRLDPPVVRCPIGGCGRQGTHDACIYWSQCHENVMNGLPVLGERTATVWAGGQMVRI